MLDGIADLKCKVVKNSIQCMLLLFIGAEQIHILACRACKIG
jgi:hypothetical protein